MLTIIILDLDACNVGASASRKEFVLFLNLYTKLLSSAIETLAGVALNLPEYSAFYRRVISPSGRQKQRKVSRLLPPELNTKLNELLKADQEIEMLPGSALFCRKIDFETINGFDKYNLLLRRRLGYAHNAVMEHIGEVSLLFVESLEEFKFYHFMK
ncbi:MAG: hypothetical protein HRT83_07120 [Hyphomicrobiaceae bacterium]|nr:hypothetical protein [Hyphomicrobiaceae bacterium]